MKIAVVTWYNSYNYGTCLQAYALCRYLEECGHDVYMINMTYYIDYSEFWDLRWLGKKILVCGLRKVNSLLKKEEEKDEILFQSFRLFDDFIARGFHTVYMKKAQDIVRLNEENQAFVTGSDQIWNPGLIKSCYLLKFANPTAKKVAYSSSFGVKFIPKSQREFYRKYLSRFDRIYVREKTGVSIVQNQLNCDVPVDYVLDPTLLPSGEQWAKWMDGTYISPRVKQIIDQGGYFVYYFVGERPSYPKFVDYIVSQTGLKPVAIPYHKGRLLKEEKREAAGPVEFVELIRNASLVFTDSFHASCFSLNFERPLFVIKRFDDNDTKSQNGRVVDLLELFGLTSRLVDDRFENTIAIDYTYTQEEISKIQEVFRTERSRSRRLLEEALQN